jgi:hypothetical protein
VTRVLVFRPRIAQAHHQSDHVSIIDFVRP